MAQALFDHLAVARGLAWRARGAGTSAYPGRPATREALEAVRQMGARLEGHRSSQLAAHDVAAADLILTMTREHRQGVLRLFPQARGKVFTLKEFASGQGGQGEAKGVGKGAWREEGVLFGSKEWDVEDPVGQPLDAYLVCAREIRRAVEQVVDRLAAWAEVPRPPAAGGGPRDPADA